MQWEEALVAHPPKDTVIELWRSTEPGSTLLDVVTAGYSTSHNGAILKPPNRATVHHTM